MILIKIFVYPIVGFLGWINYLLTRHKNQESLSEIMQAIHARHPDRPLHPSKQAEYELWRRRVLEGRMQDDA